MVVVLEMAMSTMGSRGPECEQLEGEGVNNCEWFSEYCMTSLTLCTEGRRESVFRG